MITASIQIYPTYICNMRYMAFLHLRAGRDSGPERLRVMRVIARMNVGGPALQAAVLARGLDPNRFEHRIYAGSVAASEADYIELCASDVAPIRVAGLGRSVRPLDDARALAELTAVMRRYRPHIVHTHTAKAGVLGRLAALAARAPVRVHTFHGHLLHGYFSAARTRQVIRIERALARGCDNLVAVGGQVRDDLLAAGIGKARQYVVVPPGRRLPPLPDPQAARVALGLPLDGPVVAYVGRLTGVKRPDRFVAVARRIRESVPDSHFVVCGDGDEMKMLTTDTGLVPPPHLLGWRSDVETVYAAADIVVLTSDNEGMPVSLIEAGLAGVPVVASRVGSVAEVVEDGVSGIVAEPTVEDLAGAAVTLLRDPALRGRMGRDAHDIATRQFGEQRLVHDMEELYTSIAVRHGWWPHVPQPEELHR